VQVGADYTGLNLRTIQYGCITDEAGRNASLKTVNCAITLACVKPGGATGGSQTLQFTNGGYSPGEMQTASIKIDQFKGCQKITFKTVPAVKVASRYTVATVIDTVSFLVSSSKALSASYLSQQDGQC
jgi:hypothetical protein